jgi:hypothetical protein
MELAEVHGMTHGDVREVIGWLEKAMGDSDAPLPRGDFRTLFLFSACKDEWDINALARFLAMTPSVSIEEIRVRIATDVAAAPRSANLPIIVIPRRVMVVNPPPTAGIVYIHYVAEDESGQRKGFAAWWAGRPPAGPTTQETFPRVGSEGQGDQPMHTIDKLSEELGTMFYLIALWNWETFF